MPLSCPWAPLSRAWHLLCALPQPNAARAVPQAWDAAFPSGEFGSEQRFFVLFNFQRGMEHDCCQSQPSTSSPPARLRRLRDSLGMPPSSVFLPRCPCTEPCRRSELARVRNGLGFNVCCTAHKHPLDSVLFLCFCSPAGQHESQGQQNASKLRILLEERKSSSFFFSWQDGWGTRTGLVSPQTSPDIPSLRTWPGESC